MKSTLLIIGDIVYCMEHQIVGQVIDIKSNPNESTSIPNESITIPDLEPIIVIRSFSNDGVYHCSENMISANSGGIKRVIKLLSKEEYQITCEKLYYNTCEENFKLRSRV